MQAKTIAMVKDELPNTSCRPIATARTDIMAKGD